MSKYLKKSLKSLSEYVPGEQPQGKTYIKLNTNESPYAPPEEVQNALGKEEIAKLRLYSDPESRGLKKALSAHYHIPFENIFVSNGSDEILNFAFMAYGADGAAFPDITYGFYSVFAALYGISPTVIALNEDFTVPTEKFCKRTGLTVLANPNAPTGIALPLKKVEEIVSSSRGVVLIDEAYVDFGAESARTLLDRYEHLLVVGTFSKSRSMAGARLGFAFGSEALIRDLEKIKFSTNPYNINRLTQRLGEAALGNPTYFKENCQKIIATREFVQTELKKRGFTLTDSKANFLFAKSDRVDGRDFYLRLKEKGVLIRHFDEERIRDYNRITVGSPDEMRIFLKKTDEILEELS